MKRRLKKRVKIVLKIPLFVILIACVGALVILGSMFMFVKRQKPTVVIPQNIQYYDEHAFERPASLPTPQDRSGIRTYKIPIIMYHYVEHVRDPKDTTRTQLNVNPANFEGHLRALRNAGYETYFMKDMPSILDGTTEYSTKSAVLTFDDGYDDFYTVVFPLLKKYHTRATVFVIYDFIGRKGFLSADQIRILIDSGLVEIGSHTLDHIYLSAVKSATAKMQIVESKKRLEEDFHTTIDSFAYPYGALNPQVISFVKEAGYKAAASVISGTIQSQENEFFLSRIRPGFFTPQTMIQVIERLRK